MKLYELTYLMPIDLNEEAIRSTQEKVSSFIVENQGTIYKIEEVTKRRLGEETKKNSVANMATLSFYFPPEKLENLKKSLKADTNILNNIIIYKEPRKRMSAPRRMRPIAGIQEETKEAKETKTSEKPKKVEIKEIEKKLEEILGE
jgi:ribosomal protein S6